MEVRVPAYYDSFRCLAGECPHTCCAKWEVVIDEETARRYGEVPGPLGEELRAALQYDGDGDACFPLSGDRCPFLDSEGLCRIHKQLGEAATSVTCQEHPRFTEDYGTFREITLSASCPAANDLLLGSREPLTLRTFETEEPRGECDPWVPDLLPLRARMMEILADRERPLRRRLREFLLLAGEAQLCLEEEQTDRLPGLAETWKAPETAEAEEESCLVIDGLRLLGTLEVLDADWPSVLEQAETAPAVDLPEELLERIAVYFAFRYLLKTVNDGDLLGRAKLCVFGVLMAERLAAVCGLPEALRRFSCEVEHDDDNLDALLDAFCWDEAFSADRFLAALGKP